MLLPTNLIHRRAQMAGDVELVMDHLCLGRLTAGRLEEWFPDIHRLGIDLSALLLGEGCPRNIPAAI